MVRCELHVNLTENLQREHFVINTAAKNHSYMDRLRDDLTRCFRSPILYSICIFATLILTVTGPFGTYGTADDLTLLIYWGVVVFWSAFSSILVAGIVRALIEPPSLLATTLTILLFTATFVPVLAWFTESFLQRAPSERPTIAQLALYVLVITTAIGGLVYQIERHLKPADETMPRIWRRLPKAEQADITRLSSEGHFVSIHATNRVYRLRMRFADAVAEMDGIEGDCVHRSHWVARKHVVGASEKNNRPILMMSDGAAIPVSRTYRPQAEQMGVLPKERKKRVLQTS